MSIEVMNLVWKHAPYEGKIMLALLALADWSNDDGESWPSIAVVAKKSRQSERNVQYAMRKFEKDDLVRPQDRYKTSRIYRINLEKLESLPDLVGRKRCTTETTRGATSDSSGVQTTTETVSQIAPYTSIEPSVEPSLSLSELRSDVPDMKEKANKAVNILFAFYLEKLGRDPKKYTLTDKRKQQGLSRLRECFKKTGDLDGAILLMKDAIRKLAASDFHRQGKYVEWGDHLFKSAEKLEYWLNRDAVAPSAPPASRNDLDEVIRQRGGPDALQRRHAERTGG
jgi:hypothetical protein